MTTDTRERIIEEGEVGEALDTPPAEAQDDIYAVLGVRTDASALLAREMYWARIQPLLDPATRDDPDARATIEALNRAMAIICDTELRSEYDLRHGTERPADAESPRAVRVLRWLWRGLLAAGLASAAAVTGASTSWTVGLTFLGGVLLLLLTGTLIARAGRPRPTPYERLGLDEHATKRDLDIAYQARAQELLVRLGAEPRVAEGLNRLDRDYVEAMRYLMAPAESPSRLAGALAHAAGAAVGLAADLAARMGRGAYRAGRGASGRASRLGARTAASVPRRSGEHPQASRALRDVEAAGLERRAAVRKREPEAPAIDLDRRLAASLKANTLEIASSVALPPVEAAPEDRPNTAAYLLLFASVGVRRVPIAERPIRIGSAGDCDLVLPDREGVAPEHALVWRRGDSVVLHVTDPAGECFVNGRASTWATLEHGDELRVGKVELRIEIEETAG